MNPFHRSPSPEVSSVVADTARLQRRFYLQAAGVLLTLGLLLWLLLWLAPALRRPLGELMDSPVAPVRRQLATPPVAVAAPAPQPATPPTPAPVSPGEAAPPPAPTSPPPPPAPVKLDRLTDADRQMSAQATNALTIHAELEPAAIARWVQAGHGELLAYRRGASNRLEAFTLLGGVWRPSQTIDPHRLGVPVPEQGVLVSLAAAARSRAGTNLFLLAYAFDASLAKEIRTKVAGAIRLAGLAPAATNLIARGRLVPGERPRFQLTAVSVGEQPLRPVDDTLETQLP